MLFKYASICHKKCLIHINPIWQYVYRTKLYLLSKCPFVQQFIRRVDYLFYQNLVEVLIPDVLRPIPSKYSAMDN